ncbi:MAG: hypothetical protein JRG91_18135 [Deltaproteobacteria bacterium]|nr:hypothetical protein [Deltaproteobacteria bacterium]
MILKPTAGFWLANLAMICFLGACDEGGDALPDADDILAEADVDDDPNPSCPYPGGPYAFSAMGDITPMMYWPLTGIAGTDETVEANLGKIRCLDGVKSIFFFIYGQS